MKHDVIYNRDEELEFLNIIFNNFDSNKDGYLDKKDFSCLMRKIADHAPDIRCVDEAVTNAVFDYYDTDKIDKLSFEKLRDWWLSKDNFSKFYGRDTCRLLVRAHEIFKTYAKDKTLTYTSFEKLLDDNKIRHDDNTFDMFDKNEDGLMNFNEFIELIGWLK